MSKIGDEAQIFKISHVRAGNDQTMIEGIGWGPGSVMENSHDNKKRGLGQGG